MVWLFFCNTKVFSMELQKTSSFCSEHKHRKYAHFASEQIEISRMAMHTVLQLSKNGKVVSGVHSNLPLVPAIQKSVHATSVHKRQHGKHNGHKAHD